MAEIKSTQVSIIDEGCDTDEENKTHTGFQSIILPVTSQIEREKVAIPWRDLVVTTETQ